MDPKGSNYIEAMVAAKFLQKSGLSDVVLSRVSTILLNNINQNCINLFMKTRYGIYQIQKDRDF